MAVYKNTNLLITGTRARLLDWAGQLMDNYVAGFGNSDFQAKLWSKFISITKLFRTVLRYSSFDANGVWIGIYRCDEVTYNRLLFRLIRGADLLATPVAPKLNFKLAPIEYAGLETDDFIPLETDDGAPLTT